MSQGPTLKQIPSCVSGYFASDDGHIYSTRRGAIQQLSEGAGNGKGKYLAVTVKDKSGKKRRRLVHVLVCLTFNGSAPTTKHEVSHEDGDWRHNWPDNLKWRTRAGNHKRKLLHGTADRGCNNSRAVLSEEQLIWVRARLALGHTQKSIAADLGLKRGVIQKVAAGTHYKPWKVEHIEEVA